MGDWPATVDVPIGGMTDYAGRADPSGSSWLLADGRALSRTTYSALAAAIMPALGTVTVTLASPGVFTLNAHGLVVGDAVFLTTTGALPTGLSANTLYYVSSATTNTFQVSATIGATGPGAAVNTSVSQSGTHTLTYCPYGLGDASTTFNLPDCRGRFPLAPDNMGTAQGAASRLPNTNRALGRSETGEELHTLASAESGMVAHSHGGATGTGTSGGMSANDPHSHNWGASPTQAAAVGSALLRPGSTDSATSSTSIAHTHSVPALTISTQAAAAAANGHNNIPPYLAVGKIIRVL